MTPPVLGKERWIDWTIPRKLLLMLLGRERNSEENVEFLFGAEILPGLCLDPTHSFFSFFSTCTGTIPVLGYPQLYCSSHCGNFAIKSGFCHGAVTATSWRAWAVCAEHRAWLLLWDKLGFAVVKDEISSLKNLENVSFPSHHLPRQLHHLWGHWHCWIL